MLSRIELCHGTMRIARLLDHALEAGLAAEGGPLLPVGLK